MMRIDRVDFGGMIGGTIIAELVIPEPALLTRDSARLHEAERELARGFQSPARRDAFLAGRLALHAALAEHGDSRAHRMPVLRDQRGRPCASWAEAAPFSIAHTRIRAVAAVSAEKSRRSIGVDVEEIVRDRAQALLRMAISGDERERLSEIDEALLAGPIALWCAREACVKAHSLELGWFGTALALDRIEASEPRFTEAEAAWDIALRFERRPAMLAHAWQSNGAVLAIATTA
jgi:4'-phosphopantetheinyl transferase EntD